MDRKLIYKGDDYKVNLVIITFLLYTYVSGSVVNGLKGSEMYGTIF